jgi:hypothetical protein
MSILESSRTALWRLRFAPAEVHVETIYVYQQS